MWLLSLIIAAIAWYVRKRLLARREPPIVNWTFLEQLRLPVSLVQEAVIECFGQGERFVRDSSTLDIYDWGDAGMRRVPGPGQVRLADIPRTFAVVAEADGERSRVTMGLEIDRRQVEITQSVAKQYEKAVEAELTAAMQRLEETAKRIQRAREAQRQRRQQEQTRSAGASPSDADYAALGLKPGATPEQVHAAYRDACRKYHPDRLTGQSVEPHLVELAVQRFKEVSAAYQRLKQRPASAHVKA